MGVTGRGVGVALGGTLRADSCSGESTSLEARGPGRGAYHVCMLLPLRGGLIPWLRLVARVGLVLSHLFLPHVLVVAFVFDFVLVSFVALVLVFV